MTSWQKLHLAFSTRSRRDEGLALRDILSARDDLLRELLDRVRVLLCLDLDRVAPALLDLDRLYLALLCLDLDRVLGGDLPSFRHSLDSDLDRELLDLLWSRLDLV